MQCLLNVESDRQARARGANTYLVSLHFSRSRFACVNCLLFFSGFCFDLFSGVLRLLAPMAHGPWLLKIVKLLK